jgi:hypothetical protein
MSGDAVWGAMSTLRRLIAGLCLLAWAGGLIWYGSRLLSFGGGQIGMGGFSMVATGMVLLAPMTIGIVYKMMKLRAPALRSERPAQAEEVTFDADAAIERYLRTKQARAAGSVPPPASARPVFGRRGGAA